MERHERLDKIRRLIPQLADGDYDDAYVALSTFGVDIGHPANFHGSDVEYVSSALLNASDDAIAGLDAYYFASPPSTGLVAPDLETPSPWKEYWFRLFLSHAYERRAEAMALKRALNRLGVDAFVAHNDIDPSAEWQVVIEHALGTCDSFLAFLTDEFRQSRWCDQEAGYAFAHGKVLTPVRFDNREPHAFLHGRQALTLSPTASDDLNARTVVIGLLTSREATVARLVDAMVHRVVESVGWNMTNEVIRLIREHPGHVTTAHVELLEEALKQNVEVERAFDAAPVTQELRSIVDAR